MPINEAGRLRADSYDADRLSVVMEYQCQPHSSDHSMRLSLQLALPEGHRFR